MKKCEYLDFVNIQAKFSHVFTSSGLFFFAVNRAKFVIQFAKK
jgi:hypothetical protein